MKLYGKLKRFKRGVLLQISLTMKCNYNCNYCCQKFIENKIVECAEVGFLSWVRWFERFPYKIKEIYVSGGEPTLHKDFVRIVKYLLMKGYFVKIFTNMSNVNKLIELPKNKRLQFDITYHHHIDKNKFIENYKKLKGYQKFIEEIGYKILKISKCKPEQTRECRDDYDKVCLRISPNLRINLNCFELMSQKLSYEKSFKRHLEY